MRRLATLRASKINALDIERTAPPHKQRPERPTDTRDRTTPAPVSRRQMKCAMVAGSSVRGRRRRTRHEEGEMEHARLCRASFDGGGGRDIRSDWPRRRCHNVVADGNHSQSSTSPDCFSSSSSSTSPFNRSVGCAKFCAAELGEAISVFVIVSVGRTLLFTHHAARSRHTSPHIIVQLAGASFRFAEARRVYRAPTSAEALRIPTKPQLIILAWPLACARMSQTAVNKNKTCHAISRDLRRIFLANAASKC